MTSFAKRSAMASCTGRKVEARVARWRMSETKKPSLASLKKMKTCPSCKHRFIPSFNARCPKCGHNLTPVTACADGAELRSSEWVGEAGAALWAVEQKAAGDRWNTLATESNQRDAERALDRLAKIGERNIRIRVSRAPIDQAQAATKPEHRGKEACVQRVAIPRQELQLVDALDYEINASWWASWIGSPTLQNWAARYYAWKASRKWAQYRKSKDRARRGNRYSDSSSAAAPGERSNDVR